MEYQVLNKPYYKEAINSTEVQIYCNAPYTIITRDLVGNYCDKPNEELIKAVLDQVASEYDPTDKINKLDQALVKSDQAITKIDGKLAEVDKAIKDLNQQAEMTQTALMEAIAKFTADQLKKEDKVNEPSPTNPTTEGGDSHDDGHAVRA